jgi:amidase
VPTPAWEHDRLLRAGRLPTMLVSSEKTIYTAPWNVAGFPAVSVPAGCNRAGLPLAVQLIGPPNTEARLLGLAAALERSRTQPVDAPT